LGDPDPALLARQIVIPVEVPEIQVVHTAELRLCTESLAGHGETVLQQRQQNATAYAAVGHMIPAELVLRHTRRWCSKRTESEEANGGGGGGSGQQLEFAYEMHVNPDLWLIGGRRRGHFTAQEGEDTKFALMLLPQRAGNLLLPSIEIKAYLSDGATTTSTSLTVGNTNNAANNNSNNGQASSPASPSPWSTLPQRHPVPSEVDYKNHGETLLVLPDLKKTTVSLESGSPGLIESEARLAV
jgi:hypothetical protein